MASEMERVLKRLDDLSAQAIGRLHYMVYNAYKPIQSVNRLTHITNTDYQAWLSNIPCRLEYRRVMRSGIDRKDPISESEQQIILYHTQEELPIGTVLHITHPINKTDYGYFQVKGKSAVYVSHYTTPLERYERFPK